jgi:hypothetical protein
MRRNNCKLQSIGALAILLAAVSGVSAAPVTDFFSLRGTTATTLSGTGNTDDPVLGTAAETADGARMIGYFAPQTLTNVGDSITLTYELSFTEGNINSASDNFRYALYDRQGAAAEATNSNLAVVGTANTEPFRGYWYGVDTNAEATGVQGTLRERSGTVGGVDPFANATATNISTPTGVVTLVADTPYVGTMTLTLTGTDEVTLSGTFSGNGGSNEWLHVDTTPITKTYSVVGFLNGGGINADQASFQNVDVTFTPIPEPSSLTLLGLAGLTALRRRRV